MGFLNRIHKIVFLLGVVFWGGGLGSGLAWAKAVDLTGSWSYREAGGGLEKSNLFSQGYSLGFGKELTRAMRMGTSVNYSESVPSGGRGKSTDFSPSVSLDLVNDLFSTNVNLSHAESGTNGQNTLTSDFWGMNIFTSIDDWPGVRLSFNQGKNSDGGQSETESYSLNGSIDYTFFKVLDLFYSYQASHGEDQNFGSMSENRGQQVQGRYNQSFWDGRVSLGMSHQWSGNENDQEFRVNANGEYMEPIGITEALSGADDTPAIGSLASNAILINGDKTASAGVELVQTLVAQNLGVQSNFQALRRINVYLDQEISLAVQGILMWEMYESANGSFWNLVSQALQVTYVLENNRTVVQLDLPIAVTNRYVKVVSRSAALASIPVYVTELEAGQIKTSTEPLVRTSRKQTNNQSNLSLSVRPREDLTLSLSLHRSLSAADQGADSLQMGGSLSINYVPSSLVFFSGGFSRNMDETAGFESRGSQGYSLSMGTNPLDTLDLSLGYTRSESFLGSTITNQSDSISANASAILYPDLTVTFGPGWTVSENLLTGSQGTAWSVSSRASARLSPRLNMNLNATYSLVEGESSDPNNVFETTDSQQYGVSFSYNPSDVLVFSLNGNRQEPSGNMSFSGSTAWRITRRLQAAANASMSLGLAKTNQYGASFSWLVTDNLSWRNAGSISSTEVSDSWGYQSSVSASF